MRVLSEFEKGWIGLKQMKQIKMKQIKMNEAHNAKEAPLAGPQLRRYLDRVDAFQRRHGRLPNVNERIRIADAARRAR